MKIEDLDEYLDKKEPVSGFFILEKDDDHRELVEVNFIYVPKLNLKIHVGIWELYTEDLGQYEADFDYYVFFNPESKEPVYTEQRSSLVTCIHNYSALEWKEIMKLDCQYIIADEYFG